MFRAAATGPYDEVVGRKTPPFEGAAACIPSFILVPPHANPGPPPAAKATDENLTSEDWGAIIEVCDKVSSDASGSKEVVQSLIRRLAHRNANVQLYTLEVGALAATRSPLPPFSSLRTGRDLTHPPLRSSPTPSARTAARMSTARSRAAPSPTPSSGSPTTATRTRRSRPRSSRR